jgi:hypothetical protein
MPSYKFDVKVLEKVIKKYEGSEIMKDIIQCASKDFLQANSVNPCSDGYLDVLLQLKIIYDGDKHKRKQTIKSINS